MSVESKIDRLAHLKTLVVESAHRTPAAGWVT